MDTMHEGLQMKFWYWKYFHFLIPVKLATGPSSFLTPGPCFAPSFHYNLPHVKSLERHSWLFRMLPTANPLGHHPKPPEQRALRTLYSLVGGKYMPAFPKRQSHVLLAFAPIVWRWGWPLLRSNDFDLSSVNFENSALCPQDIYFSLKQFKHVFTVGP